MGVRWWREREFLRIRRLVGCLPFLGVIIPAKRPRPEVRKERIVFMVVILETFKWPD